MNHFPLKSLESKMAQYQKILVFVAQEKAFTASKRPEKEDKKDKRERSAAPVFKIMGTEALQRLNRRFACLIEETKEGEICVVQGHPEILLAFLPKERDMYSLLGFAGKALRASLSESLESLALVVLETKAEDGICDAVTSALEVARFQMPLYGKKASERKKSKLRETALFSSKIQAKTLEHARQTAWGTNCVRELGTLPSNFLNTGDYGRRIQSLCKAENVECRFHSNASLRKMGAGAFTAVDQGDQESKGGIYELTYEPRRPKSKDLIALVGKGLCFDTGGYDIKTNGYMAGMKGDMTGSAVALASLVVASRLRLPLRMKAFLGVTENHISPRAYKADDVVTALNGLSIEVVNTDAEGRMVLADTLCLASRAKPKLMIDFATLTGAAHIAIGNSYSAVVSNRPDWNQKIIESGRRSGERVWPFPLEKEWAKSLESKVADIQQCMKARSPDHLLAAYFLSRFVEDGIDWIHVDLSSADREGGLAHVNSTFTGFGVRWTLEFLKSHFKV